MRFLQDYDRKAAVLYAHAWAYGRNPAFYDYEQVGGDCTNFASQCIFAGCGIMNFTPTYGWYYITANQKAPAWTGVPFLWNFLTRKTFSVGPVGESATLEDLRPGDIVQLSFTGDGTFQHSPVVVAHRHRPHLGKLRSLLPTATMPTTARCPPISFRTFVFSISPAPSVLEGNS